MGAANVIPGVSGGTIAFITGIYEPFISALKSFDATALKLLFSFKIRKFAEHVNFRFLFVMGLGIIFSLFSIGKLLGYLFETYPIYLWAFFFGLIAISILSVGKTIRKWSLPTITWFLIGTLVAVALAFIKPAEENQNFLYLLLCGIIAMASMILPGLSGSFVLILLGNYQLIMLHSIPEFNIRIIIPVAIGAIIGFVILSRAINFLLHNHHDNTISTLTGFILGSLLVIWPWKDSIKLTDATGNLILKNGKPIIQEYSWLMPELNTQTLLALMYLLLGVALVLIIEKLAKTSK
ncbi:MAG: DUF368 domain-containing protein [Cyclobacteriaceae bacterium]|nr:DUF368 domain-containing protein [Cyclobacteriaceae bacterium]